MGSDENNLKELNDLKNEFQRMKIACTGHEKNISILKNEIERLRAGCKAQASDTAAGMIEDIFAAAAFLLASLSTQAGKIKNGECAVQVSDIGKMITLLLEEFGKKGVEIVGTHDQTVKYDPSLHCCAENAKIGESVAVSLPGVSYKGKLLLKTSVVRTGGD